MLKALFVLFLVVMMFGSMPRNWTRKTSKASWTAGDLQAAAVRIRGGVSIRKVAEETGIPFSTLQRRIKKDEFKPPKLGRHTVFNEDQENILTERILQLSNMFHGLTTNQLRKITFQCAENIEIPLNIQQNSQNEREHSVCAICLEEGKPREIWYRCRLCAGWAHEACTGCDDPSRYRCDFCI